LLSEISLAVLVFCAVLPVVEIKEKVIA